MTKKTKKQLGFIISVAYITIVLILVYLGFKYLLSFILPFVVAFLLVTALNPLIRAINNKFPKRRSIIAFTLVLLIYVVLGALLFFGILGVIVWLKGFVVHFSESYYTDVLRPQMLEVWKGISNFLHNLPPEWQEQIQSAQVSLMSQVQSMVVNFSQHLLGWISNFSSQIPGFVIALVFTIMLSFFISVQYNSVVSFLKNQLPPRGLEIVADFKVIVGKTIFSYFRAIIKLMVITIIELAIGLTILRVPNSIWVAVGIALFDALPVFGTGAIVIPWMILALIQGDYTLSFGLLILYGVITLVRNIIEPKVVGDKLGINPIVSIVSIYFGYKAFGVIGMIFMPIVVQILQEMHRRGTIRLYRHPSDAEKAKLLPTTEIQSDILKEE